MGDWWASFTRLSCHSASAKFVSATAVADHGDSQALVRSPNWSSARQLELGSFSLTNRSGSTGVVGFATRLPTAYWGAGHVTLAGVYTADTADAQEETADDFPLMNGAESGSGSVISADVPFNVVGIIQTVAGDQVNPVLIVEVWNGTAWVDIVTSNFGGDTLNPGAVSERLICFPMPSYWAKGGTGTNMPATRYNLKIRHTHSGAGTTDPAAGQIFVGMALMLVAGVTDGSTVSHDPNHGWRASPYGDALYPVFGVASLKNTVDVSYRWT